MSKNLTNAELGLGAFSTQERARTEEQQRLRADIAGILYDQYTLTDGRKVKGQAFSFVQNHLRSKRWRPVTYCALMQSLDLLGFEVRRGRGRRVYHGGKMGLGVECDVVMSKQG